MDITPSQPVQSSPGKRKAASTGMSNSDKKRKNKQAEVQQTAPTPSAKPASDPIIPTTTTPPVEAIEIIEEQLMEDMDGMIATAAYYLAERRNFAPGHELEDWLEAEQQIRK